MNRRITLSLLGLAAAAQSAIALTAMAAGPNLLSNPTFDNNVAGWETKPGYPAASISHDAGRMRVTNESLGDNSTHGSAVQCVPEIEAGENYTYEVDAVDPAQSRRGYAEQRIFWLASNDCSNYTSPISSPMGPITIQKGQWTHLSYESIAPQGTHSALVFLISAKYKAENGELPNATRYVLFDNASFTKYSPPVIEVPGNEPGDEPGNAGGPEVPQRPFDIPIPGPLGNPPPPSTPAPSPTPAPQQPQAPSQPPAEEPANESSTTVVTFEPLPPSTGSGMAPTTGSTNTDVVTAALILAAGMFATAGSLIWRRDAVRNR